MSTEVSTPTRGTETPNSPASHRRGRRVKAGPLTTGPMPRIQAADLEPSLLARSTYQSRLRHGRISVPIVLGLMIFLLMLVPTRLVLPGMTNLGRPALVTGLGLAAWWFLARLNPRLTMTGPQPIRWAALAYILSGMASYIAGQLRGLPSLEANGADLSLIGMATYLGVTVMVADGIPNRRGLDRVLRLFIWCAMLMAIIGLMQVLLKFDVTRYMVIPGLQLKGDLVGFEGRGDTGLFRIASTATHYIEFSAVMALALPFAIHYARFAETPRSRQLFIVAGGLIAAAIPLTLSRTGMLAAFIILLAMFPAWSWRTRYNMVIVTIGLLAAFIVIRPGLLGTMRSMFTAVFTGEDNSVKGRTDDYGPVWDYIHQRPWFGRGPGTFIPQLYRFLDNQWFGTMIELGVIGAITLAALHITAISLAQIARKRATAEADRHLCAALTAVQIAAVVCAFTFDSLGFTTFAMMVFVLTGATGVMWRLTHPARRVRTAVVNRPSE